MDVIAGLSEFLDSLYGKLKKFSSVQTQIGEFLVRAEEGIVGRNPRTGEEIKTNGKYFYYLVPSESLVGEVFGLSGKDLSDAVEKNRSDTMSRISMRFGEETPAQTSDALEMSKETLASFVQALKVSEKLEMNSANGLLLASIKVSKKIYPAILFSGSGKFES